MFDAPLKLVGTTRLLPKDGAQRNSTKTWKSGHTPRTGPEIDDEEPKKAPKEVQRQGIWKLFKVNVKLLSGAIREKLAHLFNWLEISGSPVDWSMVQ